VDAKSYLSAAIIDPSIAILYYYPIC